jgi:hypothetical protein
VRRFIGSEDEKKLRKRDKQRGEERLLKTRESVEAYVTVFAVVEVDRGACGDLFQRSTAASGVYGKTKVSCVSCGRILADADQISTPCTNAEMNNLKLRISEINIKSTKLVDDFF